MVSPSKVEVIKDAIKQVMQEVGPSGDHKTSSSSDDNDDDDEKHDQRLLSRLMSQLEKMESEPEELPSPAVSKTESAINGDSTNMNDNEVSKLKEDDDEDNKHKIVKELKKLNRQSFITNCLLSAIMVLTVTWQISQVSIILKVKDGVTRPFRSAGSLFTNIIKRHTPNGNNEDTDSLTTSNLIESSPVHSLGISTRSGYVGFAFRSMVWKTLCLPFCAGGTQNGTVVSSVNETSLSKELCLIESVAKMVK
ncbi:hypothetical protein Tco_0773684 [Tanacetum coccineum]|uniref:Uncharacterized protein n=1 Tax=Tanacetum coccineum TaxID=301880 RepID=A0ABQ4ZLE4_9ASTR